MMGKTYPVFGRNFRICPVCEAERLVFSGWRSARCPECSYEPDGTFLQTLHEIVALPECRGDAPSGSANLENRS
jgi:hypothetical protein